MKTKIYLIALDRDAIIRAAEIETNSVTSDVSAENYREAGLLPFKVNASEHTIVMGAEWTGPLPMEATEFLYRKDPDETSKNEPAYAILSFTAKKV